VPVVSVTRLRVRSWWYLPEFLWRSLASKRHAKRLPGFLAGALGTAPKLTFWTTTVWQDEASMKRFRDTGAHKPAMRRLLELCDEASLARWTQDAATMPGADEMLDRLQSSGRISKVRHPTAEQAAGMTVPDGKPPRMNEFRR
jgi:hypothetical protein